MNNLTLILGYTKYFETLIEGKLGGHGSGLHNKLNSVQASLPSTIVENLRYIASTRNRMLHEHGSESHFNLDKFLDISKNTFLFFSENEVSESSPEVQSLNDCLNSYGDKLICPTCSAVNSFAIGKSLYLYDCKNCNDKVYLRTSNCVDINTYNYLRSSGFDGRFIANRLSQVGGGHTRCVPLRKNALATLCVFSVLSTMMIHLGKVNIFVESQKVFQQFIMGQMKWHLFVDKYWELQRCVGLSNEFSDDLLSYIEVRIFDIWELYPEVPEDIGVRVLDQVEIMKEQNIRPLEWVL